MHGRKQVFGRAGGAAMMSHFEQHGFGMLANHSPLGRFLRIPFQQRCRPAKRRRENQAIVVRAHGAG